MESKNKYQPRNAGVFQQPTFWQVPLRYKIQRIVKAIKKDIKDSFNAVMEFFKACVIYGFILTIFGFFGLVFVLIANKFLIWIFFK